MSADGFVDDATNQRLLPSNDAGFDRADGERSLASSGVLREIRFSAIGIDEV